MKLQSTTVTVDGLEMEASGYYCNAEKGSYIFNEGGSPDLPASFDIRELKINDVDCIDLLNEYAIDKAIEQVLINLK